MRILMLAQFYPPIIGGEERHVRNLSTALWRRGHEVEVATLSCSDSPQLQNDHDIKVHRLSGTAQRAGALYTDAGRRHAPPFPDPELALKLHNIVTRMRPDIVHAHNWMLHSYLPLKRRRGARFVVTLHDYSLVCAIKNMMLDDAVCTGPGALKCLDCAGRYYGAFKGAVTTLALHGSGALERRTVDRFIAVSRAVATGNGLPGSSLPHEVVPNFVPDDVATLSADRDPVLDQLPARDYILFVGDLRRIKGVDALLQAYRRLEGAPPLVLIGRKCSDTPRDLPPGVIILNSWPHSAVMHAWSRCMFGVAPSLWPEPCATVLMEAMALGKPMVATDIGGMPDIIDDGESGLLVKPGDVDALAEAMRRLLHDPLLRRRLSAGALRKVETLKSGAVVPRIESIYQSLLMQRSSPVLHLQGSAS